MTYALDTTGLANGNAIVAESHVVSSAALANFGSVYMNTGPFFGRNFSVSYTSSVTGVTTALVSGVDYKLIFELPGFGNTTATKVWGAVEFFNTNLDGTISVNYQTLGGGWIFDQARINSYLNSNYFNGDRQYIALVPAVPLYLPNNPNAVWPLDSIQSITIAQAQVPVIHLSVAYLLLPDNQVTPTNDAALSSISSSVADISTNTGSTADAAYAGSGYASAIAVLKGIFNKLSSNLGIRALTSADVVTVAGGNTVAVKVDGSAVTQPVSLASMPLATNAAIETGGNLAGIATSNTAISTATGTVADAAYAGSGNSTLIATNKAIYSAVKGTLAIRALTSADVVSLAGGNTLAVKTDSSAVTQPVSAVSLPLPTGAATAALQASLQTTSAGTATRTVFVDPTTGNAAFVSAFHNTDNQTLSGTSYGILTGGVDQMVNGSGNLDRKRSVSGDAMAITGLAAEVPMIFNGTTYDRLRAVSGDGVASTGIVQEALALWNGTTYDRAKGDATNGMYVNVKSGSVTSISSDVVSSGSITVTDAVVGAPANAGALLSGASTAGSLVQAAITGGYTVGDVQITGLTSGNLYFEGSLDSTTGVDGSWALLYFRQLGAGNNSFSGVAISNGVFRGNISGLKYFRVRSVGALSGTPAIVIRASAGIDAVYLNAPLPTGANTIGSIASITGALPTGGNVIGAVTQSGTWNIGSITTLPSLPAGGNAIGSITNTSFAATQATAANLNATVVGTGTFATQISAALPTGGNVIGIVTAKLQDGSGTALSTTAMSGKNRLDVTLAGGGATGAAVPLYADVLGGTDGTLLRALLMDTLGRAQVNPLGTPGVARQVGAGSTSTNQVLTTTVTRVSVYASGADMRYAVGSSAQTASATTSHWLASGERLDMNVPLNGNIAVIRAGSVSGTLEITELV